MQVAAACSCRLQLLLLTCASRGSCSLAAQVSQFLFGDGFAITEGDAWRVRRQACSSLRALQYAACDHPLSQLQRSRLLCSPLLPGAAACMSMQTARGTHRLIITRQAASAPQLRLECWDGRKAVQPALHREYLETMIAQVFGPSGRHLATKLQVLPAAMYQASEQQVALHDRGTWSGTAYNKALTPHMRCCNVQVLSGQTKLCPPCGTQH